MAPQLKILHIIDTNGIGGAQSLLRGILEHNAKTEHRAFVLRRHHRELLHRSDRIEIFPSSSKYSFGPRNRLKTIVDQHGFDVLHCHLPRSELFAGLLPGSNATRPFLVAHEHGQILGSDDHGFFTDLAYGSLKRVLKGKFHHHIAVSSQAKDALISRIGISGEQITTIPSFFNTNEFNPSIRLEKRAIARQENGISADEFVIGIAGRIIAKKGWKVFLEALNILNKSCRTPRAVVTGDGPERQEFEQTVQAFDLTAKIVDIKWVDDIRDFYSKLDCFIAPSYAEGSPVAAREAMAMGLPIIASTASGFRDLIEDGISGLLFEVGDSQHLADRIDQVANSADLANSLSVGAAACAERFSVPNYLTALDEVYSSILRNQTSATT